MAYRHKIRGTIYLTCIDSDTPGWVLVTTVYTKTPYPVRSDSIEEYNPKLHKMTIKLPKPENQKDWFLRGGDWVQIKSNNPHWLRKQIDERKRDLHQFKNEESLLVEVSYIAAMQYRLDHLYDKGL